MPHQLPPLWHPQSHQHLVSLEASRVLTALPVTNLHFLPLEFSISRELCTSWFWPPPCLLTPSPFSVLSACPGMMFFRAHQESYESTSPGALVLLNVCLASGSFSCFFLKLHSRYHKTSWTPGSAALGFLSVNAHFTVVLYILWPEFFLLWVLSVTHLSPLITNMDTLLLTKVYTLLRFPQFSATVLILFWGPIQDSRFHGVVMSPRAPLGCEVYMTVSHFPCFWRPWQLWAILVWRMPCYWNLSDVLCMFRLGLGGW